MLGRPASLIMDGQPRSVRPLPSFPLSRTSKNGCQVTRQVPGTREVSGTSEVPDTLQFAKGFVFRGAWHPFFDTLESGNDGGWGN